MGAAPGGTAGADQPEARRFIVVLRDGVGDPGEVAREHSARHGAEVDFVYGHALKGYAATFRGTGASEAAQDGRVAYVEPDGVVTASTTQSGATWGLDRIDQRALPLSTRYTYTNTGAGVTAYIIDTGIRFSHADFGGRAVSGYDCVNGGSADDCNGHGTHVAETVGGSTYGVAQRVRLVGVRVLDCGGSGTTSGVIAGIDSVTGNHRAGAPAVANMSLGGGNSPSLCTAIANSAAKGIVYAVAAGNSATDAKDTSPANCSPHVLATSAVADFNGAGGGGAAATCRADVDDTLADFSNYGQNVNIAAPGVCIYSTWKGGSYNTISGTSMASPHVAGAAALYIRQNNLKPADAAGAQVVRNALITNGIPQTDPLCGFTGDTDGVPERLLYVGTTRDCASPQ